MTFKMLVPEISGPGDFISAYWGASNATILPPYTQDGSTWSEGYELVLHLNSNVSDSAASPVTVILPATRPPAGTNAAGWRTPASSTASVMPRASISAASVR